MIMPFSGPARARFKSPGHFLISLSVFLSLTPGSESRAEVPGQLRVDFGKATRLIRPLHGINKGSIAAGGLIDLTDSLRALNPPSARLHDCHWPNPDVVDIHAVFPNFNADPTLASSYEFALTDEYIDATRRTGAEIIYRLGESIEHTSTKRFAHPPKDFEKWTAVCLGIIRHYNEGWAGGARHQIRYWEIWNEPENRPAMWSGSDDDYFRLYRVASQAIKQRYPKLKVGGPSVGHSGKFVNNLFEPGTFVTNFLGFCRRESLPLDFFSWHCYSAESAEIVARAHAIRRLLDDYGYRDTESHLNEWNYLPGNTWKPVSRSSKPETRQRFYEEMSGPAGGAFIATALMELQEAPVDGCNLFHGELGGFGLFNDYGVPQPNYHALRAFSALLETPQGVESQGAAPGRLAITAGVNTNHSAATILISNFDAAQSQFHLTVTNLPWTGATILETRRVNAKENLDQIDRQTNAASHGTMTLELKSPAITLIGLRPVVQR